METKHISISNGMYDDFRVLGVLIVPTDTDLDKLDEEFRLQYKGAWYDYEQDFFKYLKEEFELLVVEEYFVEEMPWRRELDYDNS